MINGDFDSDPTVATISVESWTQWPARRKKCEFSWFEEQKSLLPKLKILQGIRRLSIGQYGILFIFFNSKFRRCFPWTENTWAWNRGANESDPPHKN
jgi:hypothetical protein